jgi:hypothetical protein
VKNIHLDLNGERAVQQSSETREDCLDDPGSSFLWIGELHFSRSEVATMRNYLNRWLDTGRLFKKNDE